MTEPSTGTSSSNGYPLPSYSPSESNPPLVSWTLTKGIGLAFTTGTPSAGRRLVYARTAAASEQKIEPTGTGVSEKRWIDDGALLKGGPKRSRPASSLKAWHTRAILGIGRKPPRSTAMAVTARNAEIGSQQLEPPSLISGKAGYGRGMRTGIGILWCYIEAIKRDDFKLPKRKVLVVDQDRRAGRNRIGSSGEKEEMGEDDEAYEFHFMLDSRN